MISASGGDPCPKVHCRMTLLWFFAKASSPRSTPKSSVPWRDHRALLENDVRFLESVAVTSRKSPALAAEVKAFGELCLFHDVLQYANEEAGSRQ